MTTIANLPNNNNTAYNVQLANINSTQVNLPQQAPKAPPTTTQPTTPAFVLAGNLAQLNQTQTTPTQNNNNPTAVKPPPTLTTTTPAVQTAPQTQPTPQPTQAPENVPTNIAPPTPAQLATAAQEQPTPPPTPIANIINNSPVGKTLNITA